ncbi:apolipoprotein D-like [Tubulanus polymorphus]|uniref:apolipoprotein D-like n=1 Tax=Tubulanus polymorphus TaxID=672921 RepID=UPI003DA58AC5
MERAISVVFYLALIGCVSAQIPRFGSCPDVEVMEDFDVTKYTGIWYEYQRYFTFFEINGKCGKATYTLDTSDNSIIVENNGINAKTGAESYTKGKAVAPNKDIPAKLEVSFPVAGPFAKGKYWVLDTDYETYSVVYSCSADVKLAHADIVWILSRDRSGLSKATKEKIYALLKSQGIRTWPLNTIDQTNCPN